VLLFGEQGHCLFEIAMTTPQKNLIVIFILLLAPLAVAANFLTQCPVLFWVQVKADNLLTVRAGPGTTYKALRYINTSAGQFAITQIQGDWYKTCAGEEWVHSGYVDKVTSTPAPTPTRTLTPTRTPTKAPNTPVPTPSPSPSRLPTITSTIPGLNTVTPAPTVNPYIIYEYGEDGIAIMRGYCVQACEWTVTLENLPTESDNRRR
jgi:hypothetical protein